MVSESDPLRCLPPYLSMPITTIVLWSASIPQIVTPSPYPSPLDPRPGNPPIVLARYPWKAKPGTPRHLTSPGLSAGYPAVTSPQAHSAHITRAHTHTHTQTLYARHLPLLLSPEDGLTSSFTFIKSSSDSHLEEGINILIPTSIQGNASPSASTSCERFSSHSLPPDAPLILTHRKERKGELLRQQWETPNPAVKHFSINSPPILGSLQHHTP